MKKENTFIPLVMHKPDNQKKKKRQQVKWYTIMF